MHDLNAAGSETNATLRLLLGIQRHFLRSVLGFEFSYCSHCSKMRAGVTANIGQLKIVQRIALCVGMHAFVPIFFNILTF